MANRYPIPPHYKDGLDTTEAHLLMRSNSVFTEYCDNCHGFVGKDDFGRTCETCGGKGYIIRRCPR